MTPFVIYIAGPLSDLPAAVRTHLSEEVEKRDKTATAAMQKLYEARPKDSRVTCYDTGYEMVLTREFPEVQS